MTCDQGEAEGSRISNNARNRECFPAKFVAALLGIGPDQGDRQPCQYLCSKSTFRVAKRIESLLE
jgi:hypothetical protein